MGSRQTKANRRQPGLKTCPRCGTGGVPLFDAYPLESQTICYHCRSALNMAIRANADPEARKAMLSGDGKQDKPRILEFLQALRKIRWPLAVGVIL